MIARVLGGLFLLLCDRALLAEPRQVIIVRHAEPYADSGSFADQLTPQGLRRAGGLASLLTLSDPATTSPPEVVFACKPVGGGRNTIRCLQTISSVATTLGLNIHLAFGFGEEEALAGEILNGPAYEGKNVLICWHHPNIGALVNAFGYLFPFDPYPEDRFDLIWFMTFPAPIPAVEATCYLQELLYGDSDVQP